MNEIIASGFSLISVWLTIRRSVWCWPIGIIGITAFFLLFYKSGDWCNMILQVLFVLQSIYGWYWWNDNKEVPVDRMSKFRLLNTIELTGIIFIICYSLSYFFNGSLILLDSITTSLSIMGMMLMGYKILESWFFWIIADVFYIILFYYQHNYYSSVTYFIFLCLAINGYLTWKKNFHENRRSI